MTHIFLHLTIPLIVALLFYGSSWRKAALVMVATILVDVDHLLADPVYDPARCSIGFHPLHSVIAIAVYVVLFLLPLAWRKKERPVLRTIHLIGLGLLIHMALDWADCLW